MHMKDPRIRLHLIHGSQQLQVKNHRFEAKLLKYYVMVKIHGDFDETSYYPENALTTVQELHTQQV